MDEWVAPHLGIAPLNCRHATTRFMQIICAMSLSLERYANESFHRNIQPPIKCPHCKIHGALAALGYYCRNVTSANRGVLRIFVRRFRCRCCDRTVSILPSFAQPYRLVLNSTTNEFFGGTIKSVVERSPPHPDAAGWWQVIVAAFGDLENITGTLVSRFGVTLFGRYRCHSPHTKGAIAN